MEQNVHFRSVTIKTSGNKLVMLRWDPEERGDVDYYVDIGDMDRLREALDTGRIEMKLTNAGASYLINEGILKEA